MTDMEKRRLECRKRELLTELSDCRLIIRGTAFERYSVCSRPNCKCHTGEKHGPRHYVSVTGNGRQRQHYVPNSQVETVYRGVRQYHRVLSMIDEITTINLRLMKERTLNNTNEEDAANV